jgi:hypothetical protein
MKKCNPSANVRDLFTVYGYSVAQTLVIPENPIRGQIRAMTQNQRIIRRDACDPLSAHDVCR